MNLKKLSETPGVKISLKKDDIVFETGNNKELYPKKDLVKAIKDLQKNDKENLDLIESLGFINSLK